MNYVDPYHRLGLKRNPFIAPESLVISNDRWLDFGYSIPPLPYQRLFVQIIGQKGSGKTSHLLHWQQQTGGDYFYQRPGDWRSQPPISAIAFWDEANRIPLPTLIKCLHQAYQQGSTLVVGTHRNMGIFARSIGFPVKTIRLSTLNPDSLFAWMQLHLAAERLSPDIPIRLTFSPELAATIVAQSWGSWRKAAGLLHRWVAQAAKEATRTSGFKL